MDFYLDGERRKGCSCQLESWFLIPSRMFETSPSVVSAFEKFRSIDGADNLRESSTLRTHGLVVMSAIDEIISNLDDEECAVELAIEQGRSHARFDELPDGLLWVCQ